MAILPERFKVILEPDCEEEHGRCMLELTFAYGGVLLHRGGAAGIDGCCRLIPPRG